jgi:hypothetical protein
MNLRPELSNFISVGIIENKSLKSLTINNCIFTTESFEILLKGLLTHEKIELIDLNNNNLNDKSGNMIGRIIARQTQRRDQVIWMYGLRNEKPLTNDYTRGLISLNLSNNLLSDVSCDDICNSIAQDAYIRSVNFSNNQFSTDGCKKFIKVLRRNVTLLNLDLRNNPGYDMNLHQRIVLKLFKNIKYLHKQHNNEIYSKSEYTFLKQFINYEFFTVDVPQEVIEQFNLRASSPSLMEEVKDDRWSRSSKDNKLRSSSSLKDRRNNVKKDKMEIKKDNANVNIVMNSEDEKKDIEEIEEVEEVEEMNIKRKDEEKQKERAGGGIKKLKDKNKNLINENLQLRKELLALRAQALQNNPKRLSGNNLSCMIYKIYLYLANNTATQIANNNINFSNEFNNQNLTQQHVNLSLTGLNNVNISSNRVNN